jgi:hypothetical protein
MSLLKCVCFLSSAQSISPSAPSSSGSFSAADSSSSPADSSSSAVQLDANGDVGAAAALPSASASGGSGAGQSGENHHFYSFSHFAAEAGAGFNSPIGNDGPYITWGGNFMVGGGLHFSKRLTLLAEYQFIDDKLPGEFVAAGGGTSGNAHIWSLTLDPVIDLFPQRTNGVYVTGGYGFYRKLTSFTVQVCCDFYGYTVPEVANHFSSNQGGANFGFGLTHRLGGTYNDGTMKLFAEVRYLYVDTPRYNAFTGTLPMGATELIPVAFGVRW